MAWRRGGAAAHMAEWADTRLTAAFPPGRPTQTGAMAASRAATNASQAGVWMGVVVAGRWRLWQPFWVANWMPLLQPTG